MGVPDGLPGTAAKLVAMAVSLTRDGEAVRTAMHASPEDFRDYGAGNRELLAKIRARQGKT